MQFSSLTGQTKRNKKRNERSHMSQFYMSFTLNQMSTKHTRTKFDPVLHTFYLKQER